MFEGLLQPWHLVIILVIVLIMFGPGKLPDLGGALGKGIREFKRGTMESAPVERDQQAVIAGSPAPSPASVCPTCQTENPAGNKFCGKCGANLA